jgi:hypothetical protein
MTSPRKCQSPPSAGGRTQSIFSFLPCTAGLTAAVQPSPPQAAQPSSAHVAPSNSADAGAGAGAGFFTPALRLRRLTRRPPYDADRGAPGPAGNPSPSSSRCLPGIHLHVLSIITLRHMTTARRISPAAPACRAACGSSCASGEAMGMQQLAAVTAVQK